MNDKEYKEKLEKYIEKAESRVKYSLERLDVLVITLSSAGLLLSLNLFKTMNQNCTDLSLLSFSWTFFSIALIVNLFSQVSGYLANKYDIRTTRVIIKRLQKVNKKSKKELKKEEKQFSKYQKTADDFTKWLNILSFSSLIIAIFILIIFINFKL